MSFVGTVSPTISELKLTVGMAWVTSFSYDFGGSYFSNGTVMIGPSNVSF